MPFLDAKALETDPEGMAFLRAVLGPARGQDGPGFRPAARPEPSLPFDASLPGEAEVPLGRLPREAAAPPPAA
jgi:hypothetical protein